MSDVRADRAAGGVFTLAMVLVSGLALSLRPAPPPVVHRALAADGGDEGVAAPAAQARRDLATVLTPAEGLASISAAPGVRVHLAAHEPAVVSPVVAAFDEDGRLWVGEMRTYMPDADATGEKELKNRVVVLTDADHDGVFEGQRVFLEGIGMPRGIAPCRGGVLLLEPPGLYFCRDTDGDGRCDEKRLLLEGFEGPDNPEHSPNALTLGMDNWYHFSQHTLEFRFDGDRVVTRPTPGHGQWGLTQDAAGRLYSTPNSDPLLIDLVAKHYAARNPGKAGASFVARSIVADKSAYPIHATPGVNRGYQKGVLREDKTLANVTAACGPAWYDADALGAGMRGSAFVCEPSGNLVKRYVFGEKDGVPAGRNAYDKAEFLASTDERFRPVNALVGPDGALYVIDMYRGLIQHKLFLTPYLREHALARGLTSPTDLGRIYRVTGADAPEFKGVHLSDATDAELLSLLGHEDLWYRMTAQRLLVERRRTSVVLELRAVIASVGFSEARTLHSLWVLEGLGQLRADDVLAAMAHPAVSIRAAGIRMAEAFLEDSKVVERIVAMASESDPWVRAQAVCSLGELASEARVARLVEVLRARPGERSIRDAAATGLAGQELDAIGALASDEAWCGTKDGRAVIEELADIPLRRSDADRRALVELVANLASGDHPSAEGLVGRIRAAQKLDSDKPRPIGLDRAPSRWISAQGERFNTLGTRMAESEVYFDWPGRPEVRRVAGTRPLTTSELASFEQGRQVYARSCVSCHQGDGRGSGGLAPPLAGSAVAEGDAARFASVLIHGLEGTWNIGGSTYEAAMPPTPIRDDAELAAAMTYVRRSFGNAADPVTPEDVRAAREAYRGRTRSWTRAEVDGAGKGAAH
jgi:mono/diheme cytochrome c family protein/glucose/arabinose dehydrogenase